MAKILSFMKTIRNNWKKSVAGVAALSYGISYSKEAYETEQLMRQYCEHAMKYGDEPCPVNIKPRHVTVILNPVAKRRKAKKLFTKYCEPLLHLAGISVTIIQTESEGQARSLITNLNESTDAIIVAGGDGTLSDVVTGLMRKYDSNVNAVKQCPIGVIPLGVTNRMANSLYHKYNHLPVVHEIVEATLAVINGNTKPVDVMEVRPLESDPEHPAKPVYATGVLKWGAWQDAHARIDKYWYWGAWRKYATYIFNGYKGDLSWNCNTKLQYTDPCSGCSNCYQDRQSDKSIHSNNRWWQVFVPRRKSFKSDNEIDYSKVVNENCSNVHEVPISTSELHIKVASVNNTQHYTNPALEVQLGPKDVNYSTFVSMGWKCESGDETLVDTALKAKTIELYPEQGDKEQVFFIDNEEYELKPVKIKLLPQALQLFCSDSQTMCT